MARIHRSPVFNQPARLELRREQTLLPLFYAFIFLFLLFFCFNQLKQLYGNAGASVCFSKLEWH